MAHKLEILLESNAVMQKHKTTGEAKCSLLKRSSPSPRWGLFVSLKPFVPPAKSSQWEQTCRTGQALSPKR